MTACASDAEPVAATRLSVLLGLLVVGAGAKPARLRRQARPL